MKRYSGSVTVLNEDGEVIFERELTSDEIIDEILKGSNKRSSDEEAEEPEEVPRRKYTRKKDKRGGKRPCKICGELGHNKRTCPENPGSTLKIDPRDPEDLSDLKDPEETPPQPPTPSDDLEDDPMTEEEEKDLAEDIRRLWVGKRKNPLQVCNELFISLKRFNYLIQKHAIKKY